MEHMSLFETVKRGAVDIFPRKVYKSVLQAGSH